jgi:hypothetical protein
LTFALLAESELSLKKDWEEIGQGQTDLAKYVMDTFLRPIAILVELVVVMGMVCALLTGGKFVLFDFGLNKNYSPFIKWVFVIMGFLALIFFTAHLITFYPKILPLSRF